MPGIFGFYCKNKREREANHSLLHQMIGAMQHEDHYRVDTHIDDHAAIGRVSLGVINSGPQPVWSEDKRYCLFLDGHIIADNDKKRELQDQGYRFRNDSEEEYVIHLFHNYREDCVPYLKGIFVLIIYDTKDGTLYFFNDRFGYRYLYFYEGHDLIVFASKIKALLATGFVNKEIDETAVCDMHNFHFIAGDKTFFKHIKLLPQGSFLEMRQDGSRNTKYWHYPSDVEYSNDNLDTLTEKGASLMRNAVMQFVREDKKIGVSISGGLDSRIISAFLWEENIPFTLLHSGYKGWYETDIANSIAGLLDRQIDHYDSSTLNFMEIAKEASFFTDGQFSSEQYLYLEMVKQTFESHGSNFIFHGLAFDILFGGPFMLLKGNEHYVNKDIVATVKDRYEFLPLYLAEKVFRPDFARTLDRTAYESVREEIESFPKTNYAQLGNYFYLNNRGRRYVLGTPLSNHSHVEYAFPGLDYDLYDFAVTVPLDLRSKRELYRSIFMKYFHELSRIPYSATHLPLDKWETPLSRFKKKSEKYRYYLSRLTKGLYEYRPAHSLDRRFRKDKDFRAKIKEFLLDKRTLDRGYFGKDNLENLFNLQDSGRNHFNQFLSIITVELFFRDFID